MKIQNTTIAAIASGLTRQPLGIIRISGPLTFEIMSKIFVFRNKARTVQSSPANSLSLGAVYNGANVIDEALLSLFKAPGSYTGEDMAELSCHGNPLILRKILETLFKNGAVSAGAGDFTRRAFLNGKMDLTKAEAISDIISARTDAALKLSVDQLFGAEKKVIEELRSEFIGLLAVLQAEVDFEHEEDLSIQMRTIANFDSIILSIEKLIKNAGQGLLIKEGATVAITGRPNAGKSSLLNALTGLNRAIVTDIPGTTRDTIEESMVIDNIPVILIDTAGIRHAANLIEEEGIKRAKTAVINSDAVIFTVDISADFTPEDAALYSEIHGKPHIVVLNKSDKKHAFDSAGMDGTFNPAAPCLRVSALKNENINSLTKAIKDIIIQSRGIDDGMGLPVISAIRHKTALQTALKEMREGRLFIDGASRCEIAAEHVKAAANEVSSITGEIATEDVLEKIFSNFCIGK